MITGSENIEHERWLAVRSALHLEIRGLHRRGRPARVLANEITGHEYRTKTEAYEALNDHIIKHLGKSFDRTLKKAGEVILHEHEDSPQEFIEGVIPDSEIVTNVIRQAGYERLPKIIDMLTSCLQSVTQPIDEAKQCEESSWHGKTKQQYGPGKFNRCVRIGVHERHKDGFGNIFIM